MVLPGVGLPHWPLASSIILPVVATTGTRAGATFGVVIRLGTSIRQLRSQKSRAY